MTMTIVAAFLVSLPVLYRLVSSSPAPATRRRAERSSLPAPLAYPSSDIRLACFAPFASTPPRTGSAALVGSYANKFVFTSPALTTMNSEAFSRMVGRRTVRDVVGGEHARVRAMMVQFLRLDAVKRQVAGMDAEVAGMELSAEFQQLVQGIWAVPLNLPFTRRAKLERGESSPADDIITHMLSKGLPDKETKNVMFLLVAEHNTTAALITFLLRHLDTKKDAYAKVLQEQEEIARCKASGEALSWDDLCRMRYTWAAAMETLRMVPPAFSMLRKALQDVEYGGYVIPKGWQVMYATNMTHWSPAIFPDPGRFDPARFEDPSAIPPYGFVPLGGGARICPGNEFAMVETLVAVHHIVTRFRWKLAAGCDGSFSRSPMPYPSQGLLIDIEPIHQGNTSR
ncbi:unnamed protein product [Miscanthus lutarioriparius]|uniref:Cytochrome P450 n=1 Tax=Miscanthus lutarioriparius TaxID=422564 RepID=A0A811QG62_9POAL|nr:unnamed protein product [Miscanthus lutarioriparius]